MTLVCGDQEGIYIRVITNHLQQDLNIIESWCRDWGFVLNINKCAAVIFTRKRNVNTILRLNNMPIKIVKSFSFLGFTFDSRLTWSQHINNIVLRTKSRINLLNVLATILGDLIGEYGLQ